MKKSFIRVIAVFAVMALLPLGAFAQKHSVSGQVLDASDGLPVIGAAVTASTGGGTITDYDGKYVIEVPADAILTFSALGYINAEEKVGGKTVINVNLTPDAELLDEVVVLGYTTQKKSELSSSVVSISGEKLHDVTTPDVGNMLQGKVAGVMVMNSSGQPGSNADIRIRGTGSINASAGPMYVVDGVAGGAFNPNDIETLTVLKDASATALYGAAASGGVIVITTKGAKSDKAQINFKASAGIKRALKGHFKVMDAYELYDYIEEIYPTKGKRNQHRPAWDDEYGLDKFNFDWTDATFKTGIVQNYYASAAGKSGKVSYYLSMDHYNEQGTLINTGYKRNSARLNLSAPITDRIMLNFRVNYSKNYSEDGNYLTLDHSYIMLPFDIPYVKDAQGNPTKEYLFVDSGTRHDNGKTWYSKVVDNYFYSEQYNYARSHGEDLVGDFQLTWNVTDWLTLTSTTRYDSSNSFSEEYQDPRTIEALNEGELTNRDSEWNGWGTTNIAKFHKSFNNHDVSAIVGWEYSEGYSRNMKAVGFMFPAGQRSLSNSQKKSMAGSDYPSRAWALLSQAQYSYLGKYIVTASLRYDETYKFGPLNRGGYFPGISGAWVVSHEDFMNDLPAFSFLKLRAGYGKTGNDNIEAFSYQDVFTMSPQYNGVQAAYLKQAANYNLGWEEAYMSSLGVDATLFNNWDVTLDLYHTINTKLLLQRPMAPSTGFFSVADNVGTVRNMGVELAVNGSIVKTRDFVWDIGLNVGVNQNRVLELPNHENKPLGTGTVKQLVVEGQEIYSWYMPKWVGVDVETGKPLWEHLEYDKDGNIEEIELTSDYNKATSQLCGSATPWLTGGLNTSVSWKGFTLSAAGNFIVGNKIFNSNRFLIMDTDGVSEDYNQISLDNGLGWVRWVEGDPYGTNYKATHPQAIASTGNNGAHNYSSRYLEDGSFFRLRNVTLSYDLPKSILDKAKMSGARVYLSADNLLTLSRFSGMDPEVNLTKDTWSLPGMYSSNYPVPLSVVLGVDINF